MENLQKAVQANKLSQRKSLVILLGVTILVVGAVVGFYWQTTKNQIYIEKAEISAPEIALSSSHGGILKEIFVKEGNVIPADSAVAQIGEETVKTASTGLIILTKNNIGENFLPGEMVVTMIQPQELRVVAQVEEDKGLSDIAVGQLVFFTVDAFGSQKFSGTVDEVASTSRDTGVVFSISDKRAVKNFDVKIRFDESQYPELKNGMSAKVWIYTK